MTVGKYSCHKAHMGRCPKEENASRGWNQCGLCKSVIVPVWAKDGVDALE